MQETVSTDRFLGPGPIPIRLSVNGTEYSLEVEPGTTLVDVLRDHLDLLGTKVGCAHGQCGACTVLVNGERRYSCITLAVLHDGHTVETIEGVATDAGLHPIQQAFIEHDAFQCGFCTPGQIMSSLSLLREGHAHTDEDIREQMTGNVCRCAAYQNIVLAIRSVMDEQAKAQEAQPVPVGAAQ